jgi:hypothetical protein
MPSTTEILAAILEKPVDRDHVRLLVTPDVTYVSLSYDNPDLKRIMPWCGTSHGAESIVKTFVDVNRYWEIQSFVPEALFGSNDAAAMFGRFTNPPSSAKLSHRRSRCLRNSRRGDAAIFSSWRTRSRPPPRSAKVEAGRSAAIRMARKS